MMKKQLSILSMVLVCCLLCSTALPVRAREIDVGFDDDHTGYIGTDVNSINPCTDDDIVQDDGNVLGSDPTIFSITAVQVTEKLSSNAGGKSFKISDLPTGAYKIICRGTLSHSLQDVSGITGSLYDAVKAGVCYYGYSNTLGKYDYIPAYIIGPSFGGLGTQFEGSFMIDDVLKEGVTYYSYVENLYGEGYVYGTFTLEYRMQ